MAAVLKTAEAFRVSVGSNPTPSARTSRITLVRSGNPLSDRLGCGSREPRPVLAIAGQRPGAYGKYAETIGKYAETITAGLAAPARRRSVVGPLRPGRAGDLRAGPGTPGGDATAG